MEHIRPPEIIQCEPQSTTCDREWLLARIEIMMSAYRKADYQNPEAFVTQVAMNLERFPVAIIEYVTDPTTGIQTRKQWPPSLAEIVEACRAEQEHRDKLAKYSNLPPALPRLERPKFSISESYEEMVKKHGRPFGPFEVGRQLLYKG